MEHELKEVKLHIEHIIKTKREKYKVSTRVLEEVTGIACVNSWKLYEMGRNRLQIKDVYKFKNILRLNIEEVDLLIDLMERRALLEKRIKIANGRYFTTYNDNFWDLENEKVILEYNNKHGINLDFSKYIDKEDFINNKDLQPK